MTPRMPQRSPTSDPPLLAWGQAPDPTDVGLRLERRVQVVLGKGGVGRTLIACALAKRAADAGHRTLLLEVDAPDAAARQLHVKPAIDQPREVLNNLWLCRMTPTGAMREYALMTLRFQALYRLVFENRLVKYFLTSIPSLGEFTMLGKAWHHTAETTPQGEPRFGRVIIDAPATGHAITFLSLARVVADIAPPGLMADASTKMAEVLEDPAATCFHLVTLAEEMPVNEALELFEAAQTRLRMAPGIAVVNRLWPAFFSAAETAWLDGNAGTGVDGRSTGFDGALAPLMAVAARRRAREALQQTHLRRFLGEARLPWLGVPERAPTAVGHHFVDTIGRSLDALVAGALPTPWEDDAA